MPEFHRGSIFAFASDLVGEGVDAVLDNLQQRSGLDAINLAVAYHTARDIFTHNPAYRVRTSEPGVIYFRPSRSLYEGHRLQPRPSSLLGTAAPLEDLCSAARRRALTVNAWAVLLHTDWNDHTDCTQVNAFGETYEGQLCPANPDAVEYAVTLTSDIATYDIASVQVESLHYASFRHGHHHERTFVDLGPRPRYLLSICFCRHCVARGKKYGIDVMRVCLAARAEIDAKFRSGPEQGLGNLLDREEVGALANGEMARYIRMREAVVTELARAVKHAAAQGGKQMMFLDLSAASGESSADYNCGPQLGWQQGLDVTELAREVDAIGVACYGPPGLVVGEGLTQYRVACGERYKLAAIVRLMPPDCASERDLHDRLSAIAQNDVPEVLFYHYGLASMDSLTWIGTYGRQ